LQGGEIHAGPSRSRATDSEGTNDEDDASREGGGGGAPVVKSEDGDGENVDFSNDGTEVRAWIDANKENLLAEPLRFLK
jgi:hypothetical protein